MLKLPADLQGKLEEQATRDAAEAPIPVTVTLVGEEFQVFERAMAAAKEELGRSARRGQCLGRVCEVYLQGVDSYPGGSWHQP